VHLEGLLIVLVRMNRHGVNRTRFDNDAVDGLESLKRAAAVDVLALVIPLFSIAAQVTA